MRLTEHVGPVGHLQMTALRDCCIARTATAVRARGERQKVGVAACRHTVNVDVEAWQARNLSVTARRAWPHERHGGLGRRPV